MLADTPTILIVDDNPNNLRVLEGILHTAGYKVRPALNGETALRAATAAMPDLVLLDIRMPGMDGFEVCQHLKERPDTRDIPVIFISALQEMDDKVRAFQAGGVDYIVKPFQAEEVLTRARTHIELGRARQALARSNEILEEQVAARTRELLEANGRLERAMREEHTLRELLALSHHHFADRDYPSRALDCLARNLGWGAPRHAIAILTTGSGDNRMALAAAQGLAPGQMEALEGRHLGSFDSSRGCALLQEADNPLGESVHDLLGLPPQRRCLCLPLSSGQQMFGLFILVDLAAEDFPEPAIARQIAEVLAMGIARRHADERLAWQAYHDQLTGLPNRRQLEDELPREMRAADAAGQHSGILLIDLDHFKLLNDALGHGVGDLFLKEVVTRLKTALRPVDLAYRWGGDEFIVLLPGLGHNEEEAASQARLTAGRIAQALAAPIQVADQSAHLNASMGIALYPSDGRGAQELLMHVDLAMHKAKQAGRNTCHFFQPEMQSDAERRLQMEKEIRAGLDAGEFVLYYQPQVDRHGDLIGAEVLIRWRHPQRGLVAPGEFIPIAEDSGLILPMGEWVLRAACRQLKAWREEGRPMGSLAVNVSARQFHQPDFVEQVRRILAETGAEPRELELEVTESLLLADIAGAVAKMEALRQAGIRFSVDDFGTGYSSLAYLKRLPVDQLKIDRSFVHDVHQDQRNAPIVRTIVSLAANLGLKTIAEGVETPEELNYLTEAGCDYYQGYHFSKPVPLEEFDRRRNRPG